MVSFAQLAPIENTLSLEEIEKQFTRNLITADERDALIAGRKAGE
jgi:hypothetical protein